MNEKEYEELKRQVKIEKEEVKNLESDISDSSYSINACAKKKEYLDGIKECEKIIKNFNKLLENKETYKTNRIVLYSENEHRKLSIKKHLNKIYDSNQIYDLDNGIFENYVDEHFGYYTNFDIKYIEAYTNVCEIYIRTKSGVLISMEWDKRKTVEYNFERFFENCDQIVKETKKSKYNISKIEIKNEAL